MASATIGRGIVAENSKVRRSRGVASRICFEILAEAHVEHLVGLVEHRDLERRQVERAALEMVAQPARRADDDMRAVAERAALLRLASIPPTQVAMRAPALA